MKKAVVIGAGQTGRGFITPILKANGYAVTFLDKDESLISQLQKEKEYTIRYFGGKKETKVIRDFRAYTTASPEALPEICSADLVYVSVFASHIAELIGLFQEAAKEKKDGRLTILCCENGVNVKKPLVDAGIDAVISEGIIFCTTLKPEKEKLELICEDYPELPLDGKVEGLDVQIEGMPLEPDFPSLIQRKIYTYNFISAIVCYLGSYKGYEVYGDAANDQEIADVIERIFPTISRIIGKQYRVDDEVQRAFTRRAVDKFQNREIYDTIYRNARQAERKLGENERLLTPLRLAYEYEAEAEYIELVIAAAIYYGIQNEELNEELILENIQKMLPDKQAEKRVCRLLKKYQDKRPLAEIIRAAEES